MAHFDYIKAREFLEKKEEERQKKLNQKFNQAHQDFEKIKKLIIQKYHPKRIYQWGSLLNREHFSDISDIDLAVEGIYSAAEFFQMYGEIMNLSELSIDLIQIEKIEPEFADIIRAKGKVIYDCEQ